MQSDTQTTKLLENHLTYKKHILSNGEKKTISFFSLPLSYLLAGFCLFVIGLLDYYLLGNLIGHPEHPDFGVYIGQGIAVFLGGISFFYTVGLIPLIVGASLILYSLFAAKKVTISVSDSTYRIQERRLLLPTVSELDILSMNKIKYVNRGMKFKHTWVLLFIPMAVRILQFGIPIFGEHLAQDEILPTMMVLTAIIDIIAIVLILLFPNHRLSFDNELKRYAVNFFPISHSKTTAVKISQLFGLKVDASGISEDIWQFKVTEHLDGEKRGTQKTQRDYTRIVFGSILILVSLIGLSFEFLWGTDLSMVGITYGTYMLLRALQYDFSDETSLLLNQKIRNQQFTSKNGFYFTLIRVQNSKSDSGPKIDPTLRSFNLVDGIGIGLLLYLGTLEFVWSWRSMGSLFNGILAIDLLLTTIVWVALILGCFIYLIVPIDTVILGKIFSTDILPVYHPQTKLVSVKELKSMKKAFLLPTLKRETLFRLLGAALIILLALLKGIFI